MKNIAMSFLLIVIMVLCMGNHVQAAEEAVPVTPGKGLQLMAGEVPYERMFTLEELGAFSQGNMSALQQWLGTVEQSLELERGLELKNEDLLLNALLAVLVNTPEGQSGICPLDDYMVPFTAPDVAAAEPDTLIASFSTVYDEAESRAVNIRLASAYLSNVQLQPGQSFSFSSSVNSRTTKNGYVVAPSFAGGRVVSSVGGGICQVSSTLYNALLQCGLMPDERYNHSGTVYYAAMGLDAAIAQGSKDLKFTNTLEYPITIQTTAADGVVTVNVLSGASALQGYTYVPLSQAVGTRSADAYVAVYKDQTLLGTRFLGTSTYMTVF